MTAVTSSLEHVIIPAWGFWFSPTISQDLRSLGKQKTSLWEARGCHHSAFGQGTTGIWRALGMSQLFLYLSRWTLIFGPSRNWTQLPGYVEIIFLFVLVEHWAFGKSEHDWVCRNYFSMCPSCLWLAGLIFACNGLFLICLWTIVKISPGNFLRRTWVAVGRVGQSGQVRHEISTDPGKDQIGGSSYWWTPEK